MLDLSPPERALVERVRAFVDDEVRPAAREGDPRGEYPRHLVGRMRELGLFGLLAPVAYGGQALDLGVYALVMEELGRGWASLLPIVNAHTSVAHTLATYATAAQRQRWLPAMASGERLAALALSEPQAGSDLTAIATVAQRDGDGYRVAGHKRFISHARGATVLLLLAKTDPAARGLSLLVLEREGHEWQVTRDLPKLGTRGVETCELVVPEVWVPRERLVGEREGQGFRQLMDGLEVGRVAVAAAAVGLARAALWDAVAYARQRRAFGKPIGEHQGLAFLLADLAARIAAARALVLAAARAKARGGRHDLETCMAKLVASETAARAALDAIRVLGGNGYLQDFDAERYYRDAPIFIVGEGTNEIMKQIIAARLLAGEPDPDWV
ncbi:MAG: acyl-CoA dehydrogenase family protein [Chloroflexi bacterium]|nr:acyl-CoA dehydrogenase family protein [Chloroflexota bacterium]